jgi:hypothetical protein
MTNKTSNKLVTKRMLDEAVDAILTGMNAMFAETAKREDVEKLDSKIDSIHTKIGWIQDELKGIKADLSCTVTRTEFGKLKNRVSKLEVAAFPR